MLADRGLTIVIDADNLLASGVGLTCQNPHLGGGFSPGGSDDAAAIDSRCLEFVEQAFSRLVVSDDGNQRRLCAQRGEIRGAIAGAAGRSLRVFVAENKNRRFARDAADLAMDELIVNRVADDDDSLLRELFDDVGEVIHTVTSTRWRDINASARAKTSSAVIAVMHR